MARGNLTPVSVAGIEFDAMVEETKTLSATVPVYPVEEGFPVSDTIILDPLSVSMTLYVSCTPVTWLERHGNSVTRVQEVCDEMENLWLEKTPVKIVTTDAIYTDMGITSLTIKKSRDLGYTREITLSAQKIRMTERRTAEIPSYVLKSGATKASAGTASTSKTSAKSTTKSATSSSGGTGGSRTSSGTTGGASSSGASSGKSTKSSSSSKKSASILYGVASGLGFI